VKSRIGLGAHNSKVAVSTSIPRFHSERGVILNCLDKGGLKHRDVIGMQGGEPVKGAQVFWIDAPELSERPIQEKAAAVLVAHPQHGGRCLGNSNYECIV